MPIKRKGIDEKINALVEWCAKYPKARMAPIVSNEILKEYSKTDEEYQQILAEYEEMQKYYEYVRVRKSQNKLEKEQIEKCKEGNVRGIFGYPTEIENLSKQYGIKEKQIDYILSNYGTVENFCNLYMNEEFLEKEFDTKLAGSIVKQCIDIDANNHLGYDRLVRDIIGSKYSYPPIVYSSEVLKESLSELKEKEKKIIEERYNLTGGEVPKNLRSIGKEFMVTHQRIRQIETDALRKLRHPSITRKFILNLDRLKTNEFITDEEKEELSKIEETLKDIYLKKENVDTESCFASLKSIKENLQYRQERDEVETKDEEQMKARKIEDLGLSESALNILKNQEINTVGDILKRDEYQLMSTADFRNEGFYEVIDKIHSLGLEMKWEKDEAETDTKQNILETKDEDPIKALNINDLVLSIRTYNVLNRAGINTVGDILEKDEPEFMRIRNLGKKSADEAIDRIHSLGLKMKWEKDEAETDTKQNILETKDEKQIKAHKIEDLDLSVRAFRFLQKTRINTVGDILELDEDEFMKIKNYTPQIYDETIDKIHSLGLKMKWEKDEAETDTKQNILETEDEEQMKAHKIQDLDLSVRAFNVLKRNAGINTVGDILECDEPEFMRIKNLGKKSADEAIDKIHSLGLKMKWEKDEVENEPKENPQENITIESNQDISESNDENKVNDVYIDKLSDEELDKFIEDMNVRQEENKRKLERLEKLKRAKELIELNKQQDKEIEKLESQIREKGRNTDE